MSRPMLKYALVITFALATAAVGFAQRQPGTSGGTGGTATDRNRGSNDAASDRATTAADRNGQSSHAKATFEVYKDKAGEYRWRLRATNTQILAIAAQGYSDKRSCLNAIESVKRDVATAPIEEKEAVAGKDDAARDGASKDGAASGNGNASTAGAAGKKSPQK